MTQRFGKTFCVLPWLHSFVNIGGEHQVCCTSEEFHKGIRREDGSIYNIQDGVTVDEVMNSKFMRDLRLQLLDGKWPELCTRCAVTEKMGGYSRRITENDKYSSLVDSLIRETYPDGRIVPVIHSLDYRLGNICNLQCRMCAPRSSVMWLKDWNDVTHQRQHLNQEQLDEYSNYDWIDKNILEEDFIQKMETIDHLHFAGGEPMLAPRMARLLELAVEKGVAKNIVLTYNTNITRIPKWAHDLWPSFKTVRLYCSVDAFGKVNDYIRMPSKWKVIDENLKYLDENAARLNVSQVIVSSTFQLYNAFNIDELFRYLRGFKFITPVPQLINLFWPLPLQSQVLTAESKNVVRERLLREKAESVNLLPDNMTYLLEGIDQAINYMDAKDLSGMMPDFIRFNSKLDAKKGVRLADFIPELQMEVLVSQTT